MKTNLNNKTLIFILVAFAFLVHARTLQNGFVLNDTNYINAESLADSGPTKILTEPTWPGNFYRPWPVLSFWGAYQIVGEQPWIFHLGNILINTFVVIVLFLFLQRFFERKFSFWVALLFALHPAHVDAVAGISNRSELFVSLFSLLCLLLASIGADQKNLPKKFVFCFLSGLFSLVALLSKESALCVLFLLPLILFLKNSFKETLKKGALPFCFCLLAAGIYSQLRAHALGGLIVRDFTPDSLLNPLVGLAGAPLIYNSLALLGKYICLGFSPWPLSPDYSLAQINPTLSVTDFSIFINLLIVGTLLLAIVGSVFKKKSEVWFFGLWFFCAFIFSSNIFSPVERAFAEHLLYFPSIGICGLIVYIVSLASPHLFTWVLSLVVTVFGGLTFVQNGYWKSDLTLWARAAEVSKNSLVAKLNYAISLKNSGDIVGAKEQLERAFKIYPEYSDGAYQMGMLSLAEGNKRMFKHWLDRAIDYDGYHFKSLNEFALYYQKNGEDDLAESYFQKGLREQNPDIELMLNAYSFYIDKNNLENAYRLKKQLELRGVLSKRYLDLNKALQMKQSEINKNISSEIK